MQYRTLGKTGWEVSAIGMGCWAIGGQWGPVEEAQASATVHAALDAGVNLFDTADAYGPRRSEELLGKALQGRRKDVFVATKAGNLARRQGHPLSFAHPEHIYLCCDASLHRLQTDYIDLYQCHIGAIEDATIFLEAFERLVEVGKIRAYGVSTDFPEVVRKFDAQGNCAACQLRYSIVDRNAEAELLPLCAEHNIGTLLRGPLAQGVLTGKFSSETAFDDVVRRSWNAGEDRERFLARLAVVGRLQPLTGDGRSMLDLALAFTLAHPAVTCAIPGMKTPEQAQSNAAAAGVRLSDDELAQIRASSEASG